MFSVLIADESPVYRKMFARSIMGINKTAALTFVGCNDETIALVCRCSYDIIVIDDELTGTGIVPLVRDIKRVQPDAYILIAANPSQSNLKFFEEIMSVGANECMTKPIYDSYNDNLIIIRQKLREIVKHLGMYTTKPVASGSVGKKQAAVLTETTAKPVSEVPEDMNFRPDIILIAASTGGPSALELIIPELPATLSIPIVIIQHMPEHFIDTMAQNMDRKSKLKVKVAQNGELVTSGTVYIAPGGVHTRLGVRRKIVLDDSPPIGGVRPAADVLFESAADTLSVKKVLIIVLTGMGSDGCEGIAKLKSKKDCFCIVQSEQTCVVYGMPRVVEEAGLADRIVDLDKISNIIESLGVR
ncbi:MAG: hypothetical protein FWD44_06385 [Oscillospiraceae bacterium]|nr:hypothetical protein [Oscillospiraceae bacterium]